MTYFSELSDGWLLFWGCLPLIVKVLITCFRQWRNIWWKTCRVQSQDQILFLIIKKVCAKSNTNTRRLPNLCHLKIQFCSCLTVLKYFFFPIWLCMTQSTLCCNVWPWLHTVRYPQLYQMKSSTRSNFYWFLAFHSSVELKLKIEIDEPNQKASVSKVHFMLPQWVKPIPPSQSSKHNTCQVRDEKQCWNSFWVDTDDEMNSVLILWKTLLISLVLTPLIYCARSSGLYTWHFHVTWLPFKFRNKRVFVVFNSHATPSSYQRVAKLTIFFKPELLKVIDSSV